MQPRRRPFTISVGNRLLITCQVINPCENNELYRPPFLMSTAWLAHIHVPFGHTQNIGGHTRKISGLRRKGHTQPPPVFRVIATPPLFGYDIGKSRFFLRTNTHEIDTHVYSCPQHRP